MIAWDVQSVGEKTRETERDEPSTKISTMVACNGSTRNICGHNFVRTLTLLQVGAVMAVMPLLV